MLDVLKDSSARSCCDKNRIESKLSRKRVATKFWFIRLYEL